MIVTIKVDCTHNDHAEGGGGEKGKWRVLLKVVDITVDKLSKIKQKVRCSLVQLSYTTGSPVLGLHSFTQQQYKL